ncbi:MAG: VPLPA-CTERM sorting domain-containing protein [Steroidobacteraceae bacterium]|jgi:hypothetical protein
MAMSSLLDLKNITRFKGTSTGVRSLSVALACVAALAGASTARAGSYYFPGGYYTTGGSVDPSGDGYTGYDNSNIPTMPVGNTTAVTGTVLTGGDRLTPGTQSAPTGPDILAWCVDLSHTINIGSTNNFSLLSGGNPTTTAYFSSLYTGANGATTVANLEHLASNWLGSVTTVDQSAAFQIAMWDIMFDFSGASAVTANGANAAAVNAQVATYLGNLSGPITEQLTYLQDDGTNGGSIQNLATFTPVPLPASVWLMLSGVAGVGVMARRRNLSFA